MSVDVRQLEQYLVDVEIRVGGRSLFSSSRDSLGLSAGDITSA
jgi:hypothetical protein